MSENYSIDPSKKWDYENGFYLTSGSERIGKFLNQIELYKRIINLPGDILEFGVYKGSSLMRFLYLRELYESTFSRKIIGFDIFGKFPDDVKSISDKKFIKEFEKTSGNGISKVELERHIESSNIQNFSLVEGDIMKTLPEWILKNNEKRFSLINIDVDVYEPTNLIINELWDKDVSGGLIVFDDYNTVQGETKAIEDFIKSKKIDCKLQKDKFCKTPSFIIKK